MLPKSLSEGRSNYELLLCIEQTVAEQWDLLTPDERLLIRFPIAKEVGDRVAIPQKGEGILIRRELTRRFGIEMVFQLQDGSFFKWEIVD